MGDNNLAIMCYVYILISIVNTTKFLCNKAIQ